MTRRLAVVSAGLGQPSSTRLLADRLTAAAERELAARGVEVDTTVVEVRDHAHDLTNALLAGFPSPALREALDAVERADGVIAVSPIFSASYSGLFKTFFDLVEDGALAGTPVLLAATAGTARHSLALEHALRPLFSYLRALTVPTAVFAAAEDWGRGDWGGSGGVAGGLSQRIDRAAGELADLLADRDVKAVTDPFTDVTPFEDLLRRADG